MMEPSQNMAYYKFGIFYYNPKDPLFIVKKLSGLGWTFNFAHRSCYLFLALLVAIPLAIHYLDLSFLGIK